MQSQHFESTTTPKAQEEWTSATQTFFGALQHQVLPRLHRDTVVQTAATSIDKYELDSLNIFRMRAGPHVVTRIKPTDEACATNNYKLILQLHGSAEICTDTERHELHSGDWGIYDPQKRYSIANFEDMDILVAQIPRVSLGGARLSSYHSGSLSQSPSGMTHLLSDFLCSLAKNLPQMPQDSATAVSDSVLNLVNSSLQCAQQKSVSTLPSVLKMRALNYIHRHLQDNELSVGRISVALNCSKRYLHQVFQDDACGIERRIWNARLSQCESEIVELAQTANHAQNGSKTTTHLSAIAYRWGFNSPSHFCRLFKTAYGTSPGDYLRIKRVESSPSMTLTS